jgi:hypothetical protein
MHGMNIDEAEKILGLTGEYGEYELKSAHRKMLAKYHPDKFATQPDTIKQLAADKIQEVNKANSILKREVENGRRITAGTSKLNYELSDEYSYDPQVESYDPVYDYIPEYSDPTATQFQSYRSYEPQQPTTTSHRPSKKILIIIIIAIFVITQAASCIAGPMLRQYFQHEHTVAFDRMAEIVDYGFAPLNKENTSFGVEIRNNSDTYTLIGAKVLVTFYDIAGNELHSQTYESQGAALPGESIMVGDEPKISNVAHMECELVPGTVEYNTNENNLYKKPLIIKELSITPANEDGSRQTIKSVIANPNEAPFSKAMVVVGFQNEEGHPIYVLFLTMTGIWDAEDQDSFTKEISSPPMTNWKSYEVHAAPLIEDN